MSASYNDEEVKLVRVTATITFDAYVFGADATPARIGHDIADAVEMHGPRLGDSEPGDALVALDGGGSGQAVKIDSVTVAELETAITDADVIDAIEGTEAWK